MRIDRLRGRNGFDPPLSVPDDQAVDMVNMDLYEGQLGRKRPGETLQGVTFSSGGPFGDFLSVLIRHVPGADETAMELWAIDQGAVTPMVGRKAGSATQFVQPTTKDAITGNTSHQIMGVSFNGKLFFAGWDSTVNRAQVWDGSTVRRVGLATPAAPTAATLGGAGLTFTRYYKVAYTVQSGGVTLRRSELSPSVTQAITDDTGVRVTKPATISEGETHWEVYVSSDNSTFYLLATTVVGTTTVDDTAATISTTTAAPLVGTNYPPPSAKFIATDGNRLLYYGAMETSAGDSVEPKNGRVWFTPPIGSSLTTIGDDERIPIQSAAGGQRNYIDVGENTGGEPRGLAGPLHGSMYAFQSNGITELTPTGRATTPYRRFQIKTMHGALSQKSIVEAPDAAGNPCIYFLSPHDGPRRIGKHGIEWVGADVKDIWDRVNVNVTGLITAHGLYYPDLNQIWWWVATDGNTSPDTRLTFDISEGVAGFAEGMPAIRKGWTRATGQYGAVSASSCLFSAGLLASGVLSKRLKPFVGHWGPGLSQCDSGTATVQAYLDTKPYPIADVAVQGAVTSARVLADVADGVPLQLTATADFGLFTEADVVSLTPEADETVVQRRFQGMELADATIVSFRLGDPTAQATAWTAHVLDVGTEGQEPR